MKPAHWIRRTHLLRADEYICSRCGTSCGKPHKLCSNCRSTIGRSRFDPSWADEAEGLSALLDDDR